jgi:signal peptidase I
LPDQPRPAGDNPVPDGAPEATAVATRSTTRTLIEWAVVLAAAVILALVIKTFFFQTYWIPSESMEPTLHVGDRVLVNKLSYRAHDVNRGDIVVFHRPDNAPARDVEDLIKRVIALPGESIIAHDGKVYLNGDVLDEPYLPQGTETPSFQETIVPAGHVFVLGDNRGDSQASNVFGPIDEDLIIGRAFVRVWPLSHLGGL